MTKPETPFQWLADKIKGIETPDWLVEILQAVQDIIVEIVLQIGKAYIDKLKDKIVEINKENISSHEKFQTVFDYAKIELKLVLSDSNLNFLIEYLVNKLKKEKII